MNYQLAKNISNFITYNIKGLHVSGSLKRKSSIINDIDYITKKPLNPIKNELYKLFDNIETLKDGMKHKSFLLEIYDQPVQLDIWKAENDYELFYKRFNRDLERGKSIYYKKQARKLGYKLTENGLYDESGNIVNITDTNQLKDFLKNA